MSVTYKYCIKPVLIGQIYVTHFDDEWKSLYIHTDCKHVFIDIYTCDPWDVAFKPILEILFFIFQHSLSLQTYKWFIYQIFVTTILQKFGHTCVFLMCHLAISIIWCSLTFLLIICSNLPAVETITVNLYREADRKKKKDRNQLLG